MRTGLFKILALDLGRKKVGIAISDELYLTARGITTANIKDLDAEIERICLDNRVGLLLVGIPLSSSGELNRSAERTQKFAAKLAARHNLPLEFWDERLTSWDARERLREAKYSPKQIVTLEDQEAARLILVSYMNHLAEIHRREALPEDI